MLLITAHHAGLIWEMWDNIRRILSLSLHTKSFFGP